MQASKLLVETNFSAFAYFRLSISTVSIPQIIRSIIFDLKIHFSLLLILFYILADA